MVKNLQQIIDLSDGVRSSIEIGEVVGLCPRYVRRIQQRYDLPRLKDGSRHGNRNHEFVAGRRICRAGYAYVTAPVDHPYARKRSGRKNIKLILEHRFVLEQKLGRYLLPSEIVDHIDGLTLHNSPNNLRLFENNGEHLRNTITGLPKKTSASGIKNIKTRYRRTEDFVPVDTYQKRLRRGDVRLRQILLAALQLGTDSPYLLGTHRHLKKAGIDPSDRSRIEHALADLEKRLEADLLL